MQKKLGKVRSGRGWGSRGRRLVGSNVGGRVDVGYGGCEPRIEGIVQCTKRSCTILRKIKKNVVVGGGGPREAIFEP